MTLLIGQKTAATNSDNLGTDRTTAWKFPALASGEVAAIYGQTKVTNADVSAVWAGIYADNGADYPGALLGFAAVESLAAAQGTGVWRAILPARVAIVLGTQYWLSVRATGQWDFQGDSAASAYREDNGATNHPDPYPAGQPAFNTRAILWGEDGESLSPRPPMEPTRFGPF